MDERKFDPLTQGEVAGTHGTKTNDGELVVPIPAAVAAPAMIHPKLGKPQAVWTYRDESGAALAYVARYATPGGPKDKEFRPCTWRRFANGKCRWSWQSYPRDRKTPLYGLERLAENDGILVTEGEKCADLARRVFPKLAVVSSMGGAKAARMADWSPLKGRRALIWPDHDAPGAAYAADVAACLDALGVKAEIVDAAGLVELAVTSYGDRVERQGFDVENALKLWEDPEALRQAALKLAKPWTPPPPRRGWQALCILNDKGQIVSNLANVMVALRADPSLESVFTFDEMEQAVKLETRLPVAPNGKHAGTDPAPRLVRDEDVSQLQEWLQHQGLPRIGKDTIHQAVDQRARERSFHPVRDWLDSLKWDGKSRVAGWLQTYFGATGNDIYLNAIGQMFLISMVARVEEPGCKADYMLVCEGEQGIEKSRACQRLAGVWFSDALPDIHAKDARQHLRGKWLIEVAELSAFTRAESEALKAFITRDCERYRPPYGRKDVVEPRQCIFFGTTNRSVYIKDETGGRRFWPFAAGHVDIEALDRDRDQLFAEAVVCYRRGEHWWPDGAFERLYIKPEQDGRYDADLWEESIKQYVATRSRVSVLEIARGALDFDAAARVGTSDQRRITGVLTTIGWRPGRDSRGRFYEPSLAEMQARGRELRKC
jgi:predicted P-loop ATPase